VNQENQHPGNGLCKDHYDLFKERHEALKIIQRKYKFFLKEKREDPIK
jgi:hypothetical protein